MKRSAYTAVCAGVLFPLHEAAKGHDSVARLRALGFRFVLITRGNNFIEDLTARRPFFRSLYSHQPAGVTPDYFVYDLYLATPTPSPATAAPPHVL